MKSLKVPNVIVFLRKPSCDAPARFSVVKRLKRRFISSLALPETPVYPREEQSRFMSRPQSDFILGIPRNFPSRYRAVGADANASLNAILAMSCHYSPDQGIWHKKIRFPIKMMCSLCSF